MTLSPPQHHPILLTAFYQKAYAGIVSGFAAVIVFFVAGFYIILAVVLADVVK